MGWDISYHPISEKQINEWYFDVIDNQELINTLSTEHKIEDLYKEKYKEVIKIASESKVDDVFDKSHGYCLAVVQGFFQKYFYTRGAALSFSENPILKSYYKEWAEIIPIERLTKTINNRITENYSSGVYIPKNKISELLNDYENSIELRKELDDLFSHNRIDVFIKALRFANENELGLLEATEVIEPNPMDLNSSTCYSNLFNCDPDGALIYQEEAMKQIQAAMEKIKDIGIDQEEKAEEKAEEKKSSTEASNTKSKSSFWKKLFGR